MANIDTTQLSAVNTMLRWIGEAPVNSLTDGVTLEVSLAVDVLDEVSKDVQLHGWHWNTDLEVEVSRNADGKYAWELDWIRFDLVKNEHDLDLVRRGDFLYNRRKSTFEFTQSTLKGHAVKYLDWENVPEAARSFILKEATVQFQDAIQGDESRHAYSQEVRDQAWANLMQHELDQGDYNILDGGVAAEVGIHRSGGDGLTYGKAVFTGD